jgi:trigger factor
MTDHDQNPTPPGPFRTTVEAPEPWQRVIRAEVSRDYYDREYATRLKQAVKSHQKPGFRKGRTPKALVEKEMGGLLRMETVESLVPKAWMSAVLEHKLAPLTDPQLENLEFEDGGPLKFDLVVEVRPEITLQSIDDIPVKRRAVEVRDEDVDDVLTRLRESRATFASVARPSRTDDQITLDLVPGAWEGQSEGGQVIADQKFVLGSPNNMDAFNEGLVGLAAGDEKDVEVSYPDDHPNESLKGQTVTFTCRIKEVAEKALPQLDDELAASVSAGKTLDGLRDEIRADLTREAERRVAGELDAQVRDALIARHDVPVPPSMLDGYLKSSLEELRQRNARMGRATSPEEEQAYREQGRPHAEKALRGMLLLEAVRRQEDIKVADEDVDARIGEIAAENGFDVEKYREFVNSGDERQRLEYDLLERRTYDFLLSRAVFEDVPADTEIFKE